MNNRIKISITGKNPDYFLKEIIKQKINIFAVEKTYKSINIIIDFQDLEKITSMKTTYKIKIVERYGISKIKFLLKKYAIFLAFITMGIIINIILSNLIFNVEVVHSNKELVKVITKDLSDMGIKKFHLKVSYSKKEAIKNKLLEKERDLLEWIEIEEKGTKYIVRIEQRKKNNPEKKCYPRHIVAKKNALIKEIHADAGEVVKKKNDYVTKGETIISGLIHNKEKVVSKRCTIGKIYGEVWYKVKVKVPKKYEEKKITKEKNYGLSFTFLKKSYDFLNKFPTYQKIEYNIVDSKIIPIKFGLAKYTKTQEKTKNYTIATVDSKAIELAENKIKKQLKKDESIISKKVLKKQENNSRIEVEVFFKVKENITEYFDITNLNIEEMNKKEEE